MASPRAAYSPENVRSNALFDDDDYLDAVATPGGGKPTSSSTFSFESLKDPRIDWGAIAACDSREARRSTDIDALENALEACVRADVDSVAIAFNKRHEVTIAAICSKRRLFLVASLTPPV